MSAPSLDIDALSLGPNKCIIVGPVPTSYAPTPSGTTPRTGVTAILTSELILGVNADYGALFNPAINEQLDQIVGQITAIGGGLTTQFDTLRNRLSTRNVQQSALVWRGTEQPIFTLNLLLLTLSFEDDILGQVQTLYSMVFPQNADGTTSSNSNSTGSVIAPLGYFPTVSQQAYENTVGFQLGDGEYAWFQALNLVAKNVSFAFSQEIATNGQPLYAVGQVVLQPARMITFRDFQQYFIKSGNSGVIGSD